MAPGEAERMFGDYFAIFPWDPALSASKDDASPLRPVLPPGGLMELSNASLQRGCQG
jgi:hypothetical protein